MLTLTMILRALDVMMKLMKIMTTTVVTMVLKTSGKMTRMRRKWFSDWRTWQYQLLPLLGVEAKVLL